MRRFVSIVLVLLTASLAPAATCGNGTLDVGEHCDDGNTTSGDGCSAACLFEGCAVTGTWAATPPVSGPQIFSFDEAVDGTFAGVIYASADHPEPVAGSRAGAAVAYNVGQIPLSGTMVHCDSIAVTFPLPFTMSRLRHTYCGDGTVQPGEACDDGNFAVGDGCNAGCEGPLCGNGMLDEPEQCDDGNLIDGDGCSAACAFAPGGGRLDAELLKDVNTHVSSDLSPAELVAIGGTVFFVGSDLVHGRELWKTDGTGAGTVLVKDISPGNNNPGNAPFPQGLTAFNGKLFFLVRDSSSRNELWRSDGTSSGTLRVWDFGTDNPSGLLAAGNRFFFSVYDRETRTSVLWRSDGTTGGTIPLTDPQQLSVGGLATVGSVAYFTGCEPVAGCELWRSNGTAAGTTRVADLRPGAESSAPASLSAMGSLLVFSADDGLHGRELWRSDGTAAGTFLVRDLATGLGGNPCGSADDFVVAGGTIFFTQSDCAHGKELWKSDGTMAGTHMVKDLLIGPNGSNPRDLTEVDDRLLFCATDDQTTYLYVSDGTASGTASLGVTPWAWDCGLTKLGATTYFSGFTQPSVNEGLWRTDGTAAGTELVVARARIEELTAVSGTLFFRASDANGSELWKSDGTAAGTALVADIEPAGSSYPQHLTDVGGMLLFRAYQAGTGYELWKSDGTAAGTTLVKDILPGSDSSVPYNLIAVGSTLFFVAREPATGDELWRSDGTAAGTQLVRDIAAGSASSFPTQLTAMNGTLYFAARTWQWDLWKSNGTAAGTTLVKSGITDPQSIVSSAFNLSAVGTTLFFTGWDSATGYELWKTNGTPSGTALVFDARPGPASGWPSAVSSVNGNLLFSARGPDGYYGYSRIWKTDGTAAGTVPFDPPMPTPSDPEGFTTAAGFTYFRARDEATGVELWKTNGTMAGTVQVADVVSGPDSSAPQGLTAAAGKLFFVTGSYPFDVWASDGTAAGTAPVTEGLHVAGDLTAFAGALFFHGQSDLYGAELWRSDGTAAGTEAIDINPGPASSHPWELTDAAGRLFFRGYLQGRSGLWTSDGSPAGTNRVETNLPTDSSHPQQFVTVGDDIFFAAYDHATGMDLWKSDGSAAGTVRVADLHPGQQWSWIESLTAMNGALYFFAGGSTLHPGLWRSDGSAAGTTLVKEVGGDALVTVGGMLFFNGYGDGGGWALWASDGTPAGTVRLTDPGFETVDLTPSNGLLHFARLTATGRDELWRSDGTVAGTTRVVDITPGLEEAYIYELTDVGGVLYFGAYTPATGSELWKSDGTAAGTMQVADINPGPADSSPSQLIDVGGELFFVASTPATGRELWKSDGTGSGTALVADLTPGPSDSIIGQLVSANGLLYASLWNADGVSLWRSDGTTAGTYPLVALDSADGFVDVGGMLLFTGCEPTSGCEVWRTDGTVAGTMLAADVRPGPESSDPGMVTLFGNRLVFAAEEPQTGREPWIAVLGNCGDGVPELGEECDAGMVNGTPGSCCTSSCAAVTAGTSCADDGIACTVDTCDAGGTCLSTPSNALCSDGLFCNGAESCQPGVGCVPGSPPATDDGVLCTLDVCDEAADAVVHTPLSLLCNDGNACTDDQCIPGLGCSSTPNSAPCNDGNTCTSGDVCTGGACHGTPVANGTACSTAGGCRTSTCSSGVCGTGTPVSAGTSCDDANLCTTVDTCNGAGACIGGSPLTCPAPTQQCTQMVCQPAQGCTPMFVAATTACSDGDACTTMDRCGPWIGFGQVCSGTPVSGCETTATPVGPGDTVTTDGEGDGATPADPIETTVTSPAAGTVEITETAPGAPPTGVVLLGQQITIEAPAGTPATPLILVFRLDASLVVPPEDETSILVFKDGVLVPPCTGAPGVAAPDPCVSTRTRLGDGDVQITVLTSTASDWVFGLLDCGAAPRSDCRRPVQPSKAQLAIKDQALDAIDTIVWKWTKGDAVTRAELGDPGTAHPYVLCAWDLSGAAPELMFRARMPAAGDCGGKACWRNAGTTGVVYSDTAATPDGVTKLVAKAGLAGKTKSQVKGKGATLTGRPLGLPAPPLDLPVQVQLQATSGVCWQASFDVAIKNEPGYFKAKGSPSGAFLED